MIRSIDSYLPSMYSVDDDQLGAPHFFLNPLTNILRSNSWDTAKMSPPLVSCHLELGHYKATSYPECIYKAFVIKDHITPVYAANIDSLCISGLDFKALHVVLKALNDLGPNLYHRLPIVLWSSTNPKILHSCSFNYSQGHHKNLRGCCF